MIISGVENIYPTGTGTGFRHPDIQDVEAIGVPHEKWGEPVAAVLGIASAIR